MSLAAGVRLGAYEIIALIGAGGMGEVYRARDTRLHRDVALKILPELFALDPDRLARFEREAQVLASLKHANIGTIYGLEEANPSAGSGQAAVRALVLELVDGETLQELIALSPKPSTGLRLDEALKIARQIGEALEAAHEHGVIHRDLKPSNIKITPDGVVKVLDFGLAKAFSEDGAAGDLSLSPTLSLAATRAGVILGTAAYMSPEQAKGKPVDKRTDIWAFGCVLYEMLTGRRAFGGEDVSETLAAILRAEPDWNALPETTPAGIHKLLRRCLEKDRKERMPDIAVARFELKDALTAPRIEPGAAAGFATRRRRERLAWIVAAASLVVAMVAVPATMYVRRTASEPVVTRLDVVTPPTTDAFSFALSPDGRQVAFVANGEKGSQLWLRPFDQATPQRLAGTEGASSPFWAPDGRALGFFADGKLKRIDVAGGAPQVLADAPQARGGTWNRDGVIVFVPSFTSALVRVAATGGTPTLVTRLAAGQGSHRWPQFLPDGRLLFLMATGQPQTHGMYVASLDGGEPTRVRAGETAALYAPPGYLLRVSQGVLVAQGFDAANATVAGEPIPVAQDVGENDGSNRSAFSVSAAGVLAHRAGAAARRQLVWVDRAGKVLGAVGPADENAPANPALVPDGQRVAVNRTVSGNFDVWLMDLGRGVASRFTFDAAIDTRPVWSPDGSQVVFQSTRQGANDLFAKPANGATDEQLLLVTSQDKNPLDWSLDGRFLLYSSQDPKTASDLWALPLTGERKPFPVVQSGFDEIEGQLSPDGRWLAYASNESGRYEIYIRSFPEPGGKWQVSTAGGVQPRWRRDGKELFYVAPDARFMAVPVRVASDARTVESGVPVALFPPRLASGVNIFATGFNARAQYAVAPDGRFLMNIAADDAVTLPITIVLNWETALSRR